MFYRLKKNIKTTFHLKLKKITAFPFVMLKFVEKKIYSVFRKDTFSDIYTNFSSFKALEYKLALLYTL